MLNKFITYPYNTVELLWYPSFKRENETLGFASSYNEEYFSCMCRDNLIQNTYQGPIMCKVLDDNNPPKLIISGIASCLLVHVHFFHHEG